MPIPRGSARPPISGPATETVAPLNGESPPVDEDLGLPAIFAPIAGSVDGDVEPAPAPDKVSPLQILGAAKASVDAAVDAVAAQYSKDGTVSRVGVAQLRDAIDELRQAIPRQRKRPVAGELRGSL